MNKLIMFFYEVVATVYLAVTHEVHWHAGVMGGITLATGAVALWDHLKQNGWTFRWGW